MARPGDGDLVRSMVSAIHQGARERQEDAFGRWMVGDTGALFAVVADGAGGHGGGEVASQAVVRFADEAWKSRAHGAAFDPGAWLADAHEAVNRASAEAGCSARAAVVACTVIGSRLSWAHAGDCRLIRFRKGRWLERTRDDSVVQVLFERGEVAEEDMGTHPDQSRLLQSLGGEEPPKPRCGSAELADGDSLILCSDGFWEHLSRRELEKLVSTPAAGRGRALRQAVELAVRRGGPKADNATALMIHFGARPQQRAPQSRRSDDWVWLLLAALIGSLIGWWLVDLAVERGPEDRDDRSPLRGRAGFPTRTSDAP